MTMADSPRRSKTPKKKSWYALVPEQVELSPSRSCSPSSSRSSRSPSPALSSASKSQGILEYSSPSQVSTLEEGPLSESQARDVDTKEKCISASKSEEIRPSGSLVSEYFDARQSQSVLDVTGGISRESFPFDEGALTQESSSSLELPLEPSESEGSQVGDQAGREEEEDKSSNRKTDVDGEEEEKLTIVSRGESQQGEEGIPLPSIESIAEVSEIASGNSSANQEVKEKEQTPGYHPEQPHVSVEDAQRQENVLSSQQDSEWELRDESILPTHGVEETHELEENPDETDPNVDTLDQKYLQISNEMDSQVPLDLQEEPVAHSSSDVTLAATGEFLSEQTSPKTSQADEKLFGSSPTTVGDDMHLATVDSHQDSQNSFSGSLSGDSLPEDQRLRGSQVQLPLDLTSLQPLSQSPAAPSRSGVLLSSNQEEIDGRDKPVSASSSSKSPKHASHTATEQRTATSFIHYPPELQSRPTSGSPGARDSRLIRPSDLYGTPRGQDLEDSLARKVAQLLIESGQISIRPREIKDDGRSKISSKSSSCSGSPDSIDGSLTPSSQKDFPEGRDIYERRDSLNRERTPPGRESPASSVSSCTDSLALHVQQLLKESEHLRARAPIRDSGLGGGSLSKSDAANISGVSTSSSVKRIIKRVNASIPGTDSDVDNESGRDLEGQAMGGYRVGRESPSTVKRHSVDYLGSGRGSPRSQGGESPYHSDSGRESPRYLGTSSSRQSPSRFGISRSSQGSQERSQPFERSHLSSQGQDSLSQRVQHLLGSTEYAGGTSPRYYTEGGSDTYRQVDSDVGSPSRQYHPRSGSYTYETQDGVPTRRLHSTEDGDPVVRRTQQIAGRERLQDPRSTYQTQEGDLSRQSKGAEDADALTRRVQAMLMEDAQEERVDRVLQEAGAPMADETRFRPVPQSDVDSRLASFHTVASTLDNEQPEGVGNFAALERARAVLEQQLQKVSERTFDHSVTWETPTKHTRGSNHSYERPVEAWTEAHGQSDLHQYSSTKADESHQRLSDRQRDGGFSKSESLQSTDKTYYSFPPSEVPSESDQRITTRGGHQTGGGARPRSYPPADSTSAPSYDRSQSTPSNQSGIPRRTLPQSTASSGSRASHGRSSSLGKSSDFTSQLPVSAEYKVDQGAYTSPLPRPLSATLPRDHSRRSTFGSGVYSASGSSAPSSTRVSRGTSPDRNILHPYRPPGSAETMYTYPVSERSRDRFSSTVNSSTTMESTHTGSDDAQPPDFPVHVLGSRQDPPRKSGSLIPKMSPRDYGGVASSEVKGQTAKDSKYPTPRDHADVEIDPSVLLGQDDGSSRKSPGIPLDLSRSRRGQDDRQPASRLIGRTSPSSQLSRYQDSALSKRQTGSLGKDIEYGRLPSQTTAASSKSRVQTREGYPASKRSNIPGSLTRKVLTDVLLDDGGNSSEADDMWRQYQHLRERKQEERETDGNSGTSSIDESRIQKLTSLIKDPVGHTARNIAQDVAEPEFEETVKTKRGQDFTPEESLQPKTRVKSTLALHTDEKLPSQRTASTTSYGIAREPRTAATTSPVPTEVDKDVVQSSELQPAKRQKTRRNIPSSGIPMRDMRPQERVPARAPTPTKRKATAQDISGTDVSETSLEAAALSDLSLDSEQLLLLLGSQGIKKLSSKLLHLQQRIEKQKEHHRKQSSGQKGRKPKLVLSKKKTLPRPTHASTPAAEPDSELVREVADIVLSRDRGPSPPSTLSSVSGTTQRTSDLDSVSASTSERTLTADPKRMPAGERLKHRKTKDDSEVEYRTSETESDVSVLCSCRPTLRRPKSAQESRRREAENGTTLTSEPDGGRFKRPLGVAPRASSKIPVMGTSKGPRILPEDNRNHKSSSSTPSKRFPRGTAFTIDLSQDADRREETSLEKGVLTDLPEKSRDRQKAIVERRTSKVVNKENVTPRLTPPGIAWFQPFSKRMPWHEERPVPPPRPKPIIISAIQHDPRTGKISLQDAFLRHRPDFISQCRERQRKMKLAAEERHVQESLEIERIRLFEEQKAKKANRLAHPYSDQLHKPIKRNLTRKEMKQQTQKIYSRLPEVVRKKEETKKIVINETNRLRAQIYRKKLSDRLKSRWPPE